MFSFFFISNFLLSHKHKTKKASQVLITQKQTLLINIHNIHNKMIDIVTVQGYEDLMKKEPKKYTTILSNDSQSYVLENTTNQVIANLSDSVKKYLIDSSI